MKLVLMGTNDFVIPIFDKLAARHDIVAVFTRAPKPVGRKKVLTPSPVHTWAESMNLPVYTSIREFDNLHSEIDYIVVVSYGVILRDNVLNSAKCLNIHPSDLPRYRGPSPIRTAIYNGDTESAVCLMQMNSQMDAGDILARRKFIINENDTNSIIESRVSEIATNMLIDYLSAPGQYTATPQIGEPTYTRKFTGDDELIDWSRDAIAIHNQVRALGAGRTKINGIDVKIIETRIHDDKLEICKIQPAGKKTMDWGSFVNGLHGADITFGK